MKKGAATTSHRRQWIFGLVFVGIIGLLAATTLTIGRGHAAGEVQWINRGTLLYEGRYYIDSNPNDINAAYETTIPEKFGTCPVKIRFPGLRSDFNDNTSYQVNSFYYGRDLDGEVDYDGDSLDPDAARKAQYFEPSGSLNAADQLVCDADFVTPVEVPAIKIGNRKITFVRLDDQTIVNYYHLGSATFKRIDSRPNLFRREDQPGPCADMIVIGAEVITDDTNSDGTRFFERDPNTIPGEDDAAPAILYSVNNDDTDRKAESYSDLFGDPPLGARACGIQNNKLYDLTPGNSNTYGAVTRNDNVGNLGTRDADSVESFIVRGVTLDGQSHNDGRKDDGFVVFVGGVQNTAVDGAGNVITQPPQATISPPTCRAGALGWIICAVVTAIETFVEWAQSALTALLEVNPLSMDPNSATYKVWENFRNLTLVIYLIIFLIVIFSQATSIGISNAGIKSLFPYLLGLPIITYFLYPAAAFIVDVGHITAAGIENLFQVAGGPTINTGATAGSSGSGALLDTLAIGSIVAAIGVGITTGIIVEIFPLLIAGAAFALMLGFGAVMLQIAFLIAVVTSPAWMLLALSRAGRKWSMRGVMVIIGTAFLITVMRAMSAGSELGLGIIIQTAPESPLGKVQEVAGVILFIIVAFLIFKLVMTMIKSIIGGTFFAPLEKMADKARDWGKERAHESGFYQRREMARKLRKDAKQQYRQRKFFEAASTGTGVTGKSFRAMSRLSMRAGARGEMYESLLSQQEKFRESRLATTRTALGRLAGAKLSAHLATMNHGESVEAYRSRLGELAKQADKKDPVRAEQLRKMQKSLDDPSVRSVLGEVAGRFGTQIGTTDFRMGALQAAQITGSDYEQVSVATEATAQQLYNEAPGDVAEKVFRTNNTMIETLAPTAKQGGFTGLAYAGLDASGQYSDYAIKLGKQKVGDTEVPRLASEPSSVKVAASGVITSMSIVGMEKGQLGTTQDDGSIMLTPLGEALREEGTKDRSGTLAKISQALKAEKAKHKKELREVARQIGPDFLAEVDRIVEGRTETRGGGSAGGGATPPGPPPPPPGAPPSSYMGGV